MYEWSLTFSCNIPKITSLMFQFLFFLDSEILIIEVGAPNGTNGFVQGSFLKSSFLAPGLAVFSRFLS